MRKKITDDVHITHADRSFLVPVILGQLVGLTALITVAILGDETARLILAMIGTAALISLGVVLSNSVKRGENNSRDAEAQRSQEMWRLNQEENLRLLDQQARAQAQLALGTQRVASAALTTGAGDNNDIFDVIVPPEAFDEV